MHPELVERVASELPVNLVVALRDGGFAKLASVLTGIPADNEYAVYHKIGAELFRRAIERREIQQGLLSLKNCEAP